MTGELCPSQTHAGRHSSRLGQRMIVDHIDHDVPERKFKRLSYFGVLIAHTNSLRNCRESSTPLSLTKKVSEKKNKKKLPNNYIPEDVAQDKD